MITKEQWAAAVLYCKGLAGLSAAPAPEYLQACFDELKDCFADATDLQQAARQIAAKEDLFGQYPALKLWLKYCTANKELDLKIAAAKGKWLRQIVDYLTADYFCFMPDNERQKIKETGGNIGELALQGLESLDYMRNVAKYSVGTADRFVRDCSKAWDWAAAQVKSRPAALFEEKQKFLK